MSDIWRLSAAEIVAAVRSGELTALQVTKAHLARLDQVNPSINAIAQEFPAEALTEARTVDARIANGENPGLLCGVPITIKVNVDQKGHATTNGARGLKDRISDIDNTVVSNLRKAGAVIVGRSNAPTFSLRWFTKNDLHGQTLNPHDPAITPGGSSGGASAAVATGICAIGHGTDIAGSIRYPAYACGLQGLRPTISRVPAWSPSITERFIGGQLMAVSGPIARSIADIELGLRAMMAKDTRDPWWVPAPLNGGDYPRRAALTVNPDGMTVVPEVDAALRDAAAKLVDAGWTVEEVDCPPMRPAAAINEVLWMAEMQYGVHGMIEAEAEPDSIFVYSHMTARIPPLTLDSVMTALQKRVAEQRKWAMFLQDYPLLICPISGELPFEQQSDVKSEAGFEAMLEAQLTQRAIPTLGLPGLAVATGKVGHIPMGVQLIADKFREDILLAAGADLERASPPIKVIDPR